MFLKIENFILFSFTLRYTQCQSETKKQMKFSHRYKVFYLQMIATMKYKMMQYNYRVCSKNGETDNI